MKILVFLQVPLLVCLVSCQIGVAYLLAIYSYLRTKQPLQSSQWYRDILIASPMHKTVRQCYQGILLIWIRHPRIHWRNPFHDHSVWGTYLAVWYYWYNREVWLAFINPLWEHTWTHDVDVMVDGKVGLAKYILFWFERGMIFGTRGPRYPIDGKCFNVNVDSLDKRVQVKNVIVPGRTVRNETQSGPGPPWPGGPTTDIEKFGPYVQVGR